MDQLLAGATAPELTPPVVCADPSQQVSPTQPKLTRDALCAVEPTSSGSTPVVPQTELFPRRSPKCLNL